MELHLLLTLCLLGFVFASVIIDVTEIPILEPDAVRTIQVNSENLSPSQLQSLILNFVKLRPTVVIFNQAPLKTMELLQEELYKVGYIFNVIFQESKTIMHSPLPISFKLESSLSNAHLFHSMHFTSIDAANLTEDFPDSFAQYCAFNSDQHINDGILAVFGAPDSDDPSLDVILQQGYERVTSFNGLSMYYKGDGLLRAYSVESEHPFAMVDVSPQRPTELFPIALPDLSQAERKEHDRIFAILARSSSLGLFETQRLI